MSAIALPASISLPSAARVRGAAPRLRITRRGRALVSVVVALVIAAGAAVGAIGAGSAAATRDTAGVEFELHTVRSGETLWTIASDLAPTADPRDVIVELKHFNMLDDSTIVPGQQLAIPPQYSN